MLSLVILIICSHIAIVASSENNVGSRNIYFRFEHGVSVMADTLYRVRVSSIIECGQQCLRNSLCETAVYFPEDASNFACDVKNSSTVKERMDGPEYGNHMYMYAGIWKREIKPNWNVIDPDEAWFDNVYSMDDCWDRCVSWGAFRCQLVEWVLRDEVCTLGKHTLAGVPAGSNGPHPDIDIQQWVYYPHY